MRFDLIIHPVLNSGGICNNGFQENSFIFVQSCLIYEVPVLILAEGIQYVFHDN